VGNNNNLMNMLEASVEWLGQRVESVTGFEATGPSGSQSIDLPQQAGPSAALHLGRPERGMDHGGSAPKEVSFLKPKGFNT